MKICKIEGCNSPHKALGYCPKHYKRVLRYGDPNFTKQHGMYGTSIYHTWCSMKKRCTNPHDKHYSDYGGRGVKVCDRWLHSFTAFYEDIGDRPFPRAELDREDNDGDYEPGNCRWVTSAVNQQNKRSTIFTKETVKLARQMFEKSGFTIKQLQQIFQIDYSTLWYALNYKTWRNIN